MHYRSTRDANTSPALLTFEETVLAGLAPDGGLYIPSTLPQLPADFLATWSQLDFGALCYRLFRLFIDRAEVSDEDLVRLVDKSYASFTHPAVTPVVRMGCGDRRGGDAVRDSGVVDGCDNNMRDDEHEGTPILLLELFHGPTFAFKDVALQFLGNLFEYFLERKNAAAASAGGAAPAAHHKITVVGATSGDTGGAAIYGLRGKRMPCS